MSVSGLTSTVYMYLPGFPYEKVVQRTLYLQVLDYDRFSRNDPIGEVSIALNKINLAHMETFWKELKPCSDGSVSHVQHFCVNVGEHSSISAFKEKKIGQNRIDRAQGELKIIA